MLHSQPTEEAPVGGGRKGEGCSRGLKTIFPHVLVRVDVAKLKSGNSFSHIGPRTHPPPQKSEKLKFF